MFGRSEHLRLHMKAHSGEKTFECPICKNRCFYTNLLFTRDGSTDGDWQSKKQQTHTQSRI